MEKDPAMAELEKRVEFLQQRLGRFEQRLSVLEGDRRDLPGNALGVLRVLLRLARTGKKWKPSDLAQAQTAGADFATIMADLKSPLPLENEDRLRTPKG